MLCRPIHTSIQLEMRKVAELVHIELLMLVVIYGVRSWLKNLNFYLWWNLHLGDSAPFCCKIQFDLLFALLPLVSDFVILVEISGLSNFNIWLRALHLKMKYRFHLNWSFVFSSLFFPKKYTQQILVSDSSQVFVTA